MSDMSEDHGEQGVLAPGATVIQNVEKDPATVRPEYAFPIPGGEGVVAVRDGYSLETISPKMVGHPAHRFSTVEDLAAYLIRNFPEDAATTDIVVETDKVTAIIDPSRPTPTVLTCDLAPHPCFRAWSAIMGKSLSQKALMQHIRAWRESCDDAEMLLQALGTISVIGGSKVTSSVDETGATRLVGSEESRNLSVRVPPTITFTTPVFDGVLAPDGEEALYHALLLVSVDIDSPLSFTLTFPKADLMMRDARRDARDYLARLLGGGWLVTTGKSAHATRSAGD